MEHFDIAGLPAVCVFMSKYRICTENQGRGCINADTHFTGFRLFVEPLKNNPFYGRVHRCDFFKSHPSGFCRYTLFVSSTNPKKKARTGCIENTSPTLVCFAVATLLCIPWLPYGCIHRLGMTRIGKRIEQSIG